MPIQTPICDFGQKAHDFRLKSTENKIISLNDIKGENGTLIMFICNHCPYVKAVTKDIVEDCNKLKELGINSVAICELIPNSFNLLQSSTISLVTALTYGQWLQMNIIKVPFSPLMSFREIILFSVDFN